MNFNIINTEKWERKPYFDHFLNNVRCTYSMTANLDITELLLEVKRRKIKTYPVFIYMLSSVANRHKEFRTCFNENRQLGYWDVINPCYTIFHKDSETFSNIWTEYNNDFNLFYKNYIKDIEIYGNINKFSPKNECINSFPISSIPWVSFTGFNLNIYMDGTYLLPIFTMGKYFTQDGKVLLPISIQVHHAVCDGFHVSRFYNDLQGLCKAYSNWF